MTFSRLARFGLDVLQQCCLRVKGREISNHLFLHCSYSRFVLSKLMSALGLHIIGDTWIEFLGSILSIMDSPKK